LQPKRIPAPIPMGLSYAISDNFARLITSWVL